MTTEGERVARVLDDCAALLEEYSKAFLPPDSDRGAAVAFADHILRLARDHGLRTIRGMNLLLREDKGNIVLACALLRPFYELSVRLLWASREPDGWRRLEFYFANEIRKWAKGCQDSPSAGLSMLGASLLQEYRKDEVKKWRDASGKAIRPAPAIDQILNGIEGHDAPTDRTGGKNSGRLIYTGFYRTICRASHAHIEPLVGRFDKAYLYVAGYGACLAVPVLLAAAIYYYSKSPRADVSSVYGRFLPLLARLSFGENAGTTSRV